MISGVFVYGIWLLRLHRLLVGADAAVVRAAIMGGLCLFAAQIGRRQDELSVLDFVAALIALFNPYVLWDVGFQLSFADTLGLLLYAEERNPGCQKANPMQLSSLGAQQVNGYGRGETVVDT